MVDIEEIGGKVKVVDIGFARRIDICSSIRRYLWLRSGGLTHRALLPPRAPLPSSTSPPTLMSRRRPSRGATMSPWALRRSPAHTRRTLLCRRPCGSSPSASSNPRTVIEIRLRRPYCRLTCWIQRNNYLCIFQHKGTLGQKHTDRRALLYYSFEKSFARRPPPSCLIKVLPPSLKL